MEIDAARPAISQDRQKYVSSEKLFGLENLPDHCRDYMLRTRGRSALQSVLLLQEERPELIMGSRLLKIHGLVEC